MKKHILIYGLCGGVLIVLLKLIEYRFLVVEHSIEIYGGLIALLFAVLGIWLGLKLTRTRETVVFKEVLLRAPNSFTLNEVKLRELGITRRELEILELIAGGLHCTLRYSLSSNEREAIVFALRAQCGRGRPRSQQ